MKRILSFVLALLLLVGLLPAAGASAVTDASRLQIMAALEIMNGDEKGNLDLSRPVTRAEFSKMAIAASPYRLSVSASSSTSPFPDVLYTHWASGYIRTAVNAGWIIGYLDGSFRPEQTIKLEEGITVLLRVLGFSDTEVGNSYPDSQLTLADSLSLLDDVFASRGQTLTRRDAMVLFYNLLTATTRSGTPYVTTLGYPLSANGEVDLNAVIESKTTGPVVFTGTLSSLLPLPVEQMSFYLNGSPCSYSDLHTYDVLYFCKPLKTVWAYRNSISGVIENKLPSASSPSSIVLSGNTYSIETAEASYALSSFGRWKAGDRVTLLLGRNGEIVSVLEPGTINSTLYGIVTSTSKSLYPDKNGNSVSYDTLTLTATDGLSYTVPLSVFSEFRAGELISVSFSQTGTTAQLLSSAKLSGQVSGGKLAGRTFASCAQILDTYDVFSRTIPSSRLNGISLEEDDVLWYSTNDAGEIDRLILNDATGDIHSYGVLTDVSETSLGFSSLGVYTYDLAGHTKVHQSAKDLYRVSIGPCQIVQNASGIYRIHNLKPVKLDSVSELTAMSAGTAYALSDSVSVYELRNYKFYSSNLSAVSDSTLFTLTGYYDKPESAGGQIRVIVASPK